jgi:hypothetical protein
MKNVKRIVCVALAVWSVVVGQSFGVTSFNSGGTYNIDYTINDNVAVDNGTTFNLLNGGKVPSSYLLQGYNNSMLNILGGSVQKIIYHGLSSTTISGGTVNTWINSNNYATSSLTMTGGRVELLNDGIGSITISGGSVGTLDCDGDGGSVAGTITIIGSNFAINGTSVDYGKYLKSDFHFGTLTGTMANGDALNTYFTISGYASITLIPEPTMCLMLGLGCLLIRKRK